MTVKIFWLRLIVYIQAGFFMAKPPKAIQTER